LTDLAHSCAVEEQYNKIQQHTTARKAMQDQQTQDLSMGDRKIQAPTPSSTLLLQEKLGGGSSPRKVIRDWASNTETFPTSHLGTREEGKNITYTSYSTKPITTTTSHFITPASPLHSTHDIKRVPSCSQVDKGDGARPGFEKGGDGMDEAEGVSGRWEETAQPNSTMNTVRSNPFTPYTPHTTSTQSSHTDAEGLLATYTTVLERKEQTAWKLRDSGSN
jgi:hypothetical protein